MKRREFLIASSSIAGFCAPGFGQAETRPCSPPSLGISGGTSIAVPCVAEGGAPSWWTAAAFPEKTWKPLPATVPAFATIAEAGCRDETFMNSWTGGTVDNGRGEYLLGLNGGHNTDYPGNEIYACAIRSETPGWYKLYEPSPASAYEAISSIPDGQPAVYRDGRPRSFHTVHNVAYANGRVYFMGTTGAYNHSGSNNTIVVVNRELAGIPTAPGGRPLPYDSASLGPFAKPYLDTTYGIAGAYGHLLYDSTRDVIYAIARSTTNPKPFARINAMTGAGIAREDFAQTVSGWTGVRTDSMWAVLTDIPGAGPLPIIVVGVRDFVGGTTVDVVVLDMNKSGADRVVERGTVAGTSTPSDVNSICAGAVYHSPSKSILIGGAAGWGGAVKKLRVPTNGSGSYNPSGSFQYSVLTNGADSTGITTSGNGSFSKFNKVSMGDGTEAIVACYSVNGPTCLYRLPIIEIA